MKYNIHFVFSVLVFSLLISSSAIGQSNNSKFEELPTRLYREIQDIKSSHHIYNIQTERKENNIVSDEKLQYGEELVISDIFAQAADAPPYLISLTIPFQGKDYKCILKQNSLTSPDYKVGHTTSESHDIQKGKKKVLLYHGIIEGEERSWATLSYHNRRYRILIAYENGNIEMQKKSDDTYIVYQSDAVERAKTFTCDRTDAPIENTKENNTSTQRSVGSDCLEIYVECDFQSYLDNDSSLANTEAWALGIMNDVSTIYDGAGIPIVVSELVVNTAADPYMAYNTTTAVRDTFVDHVKDNYTGRVAQLLSTRALSGGGSAYGLGGICGNYPDFPGPYAVASSLSTTYDAYPLFSYTVYVVSHELGHVFGARHTHACVWGADGDTQLDDCGNVWATNTDNTPEGTGCYDEDSPILPTTGGTIMSYCNLAGGGIDLANGFHEEVEDFILDAYTTAPCATGIDCATIPPSNDACANATILQPNGVCTYQTYDNIMSTSSGAATPSCGTLGAANDVWFTFEASSADVNLNFNSVTNGVEDAVVAIYSGSCGSLTEVTCEEAFDEEISIKLSGLTAGDDYYVQVIEEDSDVEGQFELCLIDESLPCHPGYNPLIALYNATNGESWVDKSGWEDGALGNDCDVCNWFGVTCDNLGNVIALDLSFNNLLGTVPQTMDELTYLRSIKIWSNMLSGDFPDIWTDMADLEYIDLSNNVFTGNLPTSMSNLTKLQTLYVENNMMTGALQPVIGDLPDIDVVWMKGNNFSGCYPGSYLNLCDIASTNFTNNPMLHDGGDFDPICDTGVGLDLDEDGFCFGIEVGDDCVDDDNTIYPGAPELCDGKDNNCDGMYDENLVSTTTWIASGGGDWNTASNWSDGVPLTCQDVILPASASVRTITIATGMNGEARSVSIFGNSNLVNNGNLTISGSDEHGLQLFENGGMINNIVVVVQNITENGIKSNGLIQNNGIIEVSTVGIMEEVYIELLGSIDNGNSGAIIVK